MCSSASPHLLVASAEMSAVSRQLKCVLSVVLLSGSGMALSGFIVGLVTVC